MVKTRASSSAGRCYASSSSSAVPGDGQASSDGASADLEAGDKPVPGKSPDGKPAVPGSSSSSGSLREKLAELGIAGILAYGLLNTLYYTVAFLFFYLCVIHPPRGLGYSVAVRKLAEAMALTWAGSQVTKIPRIAAAIALAPFIDRLLDFTTKKTGVGREKATGMVIAACFLFAAAVFGVLVAVWA